MLRANLNTPLTIPKHFAHNGTIIFFINTATPEMPMTSTRSNAPALFPLRIACIDAGTNGIRFMAAEFSAPRIFTTIRSERLPVRLGRSVFFSGRMEPAVMDAAIAGLKGFRAIMDELGIKRYRAIATSAVRESSNGKLFIKRVKREANINLDTITGTEEARYGYLAVRNCVPLGTQRWILMDVGGGSVEISLVDDSGILWSESHSMGAVRLVEALTGAEESADRFHRLLQEYTSTLRIPHAEQTRDISGLIATGGNIDALVRLANPSAPAGRLTRISIARAQAVVRNLSALTYRQRIDKLGLKEDRADVILPGAIVYLRIAELMGMDEIIVPGVGIKEGVLLDLADELSAGTDHSTQLERAILSTAIALGRRYMFDEPHGTHVARMAVSLFDKTAHLHGLGDEDRRLLLVAGVLHDIGMFVSTLRHHKHSFYIISQSELQGFSAYQMLLSANIARYHRKSEPDVAHEAFANLSIDDQRRVERLSAILRLADALDREHQQKISMVEVVEEARRITLVLHGNGDLLLERWALKDKGRLFAKLFNKELRFHEA
jgi:exopolyphosphatase/guanosine-5'-triphosphate,3'-diphosphate pyrophosphatase